ncbi:hypothetical protein M5K25_025295 [Dendrobium thyrsiflorum]|uniref:GATA-type domain-containing protein n=1 Tax=Dendrobium thyrsiflorum TaxID=117978 RepID=A0ABD0U443_DENTH
MASMILGHSSVKMARKRSKVDEQCKEKTATSMDEPVKFCSDCQTPNTPLWRTGPDGPKSLCNACGIRYSKRRREEFKRAEENKPTAMSCKNDGKSAVEVEELKRRQREKQEKILKVLLFRRRNLNVRWRKWPPANFGGSGDGEEVVEAARLLLSMSSGHS